MTAAAVLQAFRLVDAGLSILTAAGITYAEFKRVRAKAEREGREINIDDVKASQAKAKAAVDAL